MSLTDELISRYRRELFESITPFWERTADPVNGGFFNMIARDGAIFEPRKYLSMQWRAVYMFAKLHNSEFRQERWLPLALRGFEFCAGTRNEDGSYPAACDADGSNRMPGGEFSILCESYAAIASAELFRATGEERFRAEAASALGVYVGRMRKNEEARREEPLRGPRAMFRAGGGPRLGLYMHLCTTAAIFREVFGPEFENCGKLLDEAFDVLPGFRYPERGCWIEARRPDGSFDLESPMGRVVLSGHGFETMWFMAHAAEVAGRNDILRQIPEWVDEICRCSCEPDGGINHMQDALGAPPCDPMSASRGWWSQCEALAALAWAWKIDGGDRFRDRFLRIDSWTWKHFRDPEYPEWFSFVSPHGDPLVTVKGSMSKTFFHLPRMLLTCLECFTRISGR